MFVLDKLNSFLFRTESARVKQIIPELSKVVMKSCEIRRLINLNFALLHAYVNCA